MLFTTVPDKFDNHQHIVEVDEFGDGITDEGGNPPHIHEVSKGMCVPFVEGQYMSNHAGALQLIDDGTGEGQDGEEGPDEPEMEESFVGQHLNYIEEGTDPMEVAHYLLFELA